MTTSATTPGAGLEGRRVLITGATRGIGRATALAFAGAGARLVLAHRSDTESSKRLVAELEAEGARFDLLQADLTRPEGARLLADHVREELGGLDVLVNNLGVDGSSPFGKLAEDEWHRVMDHNVTSVYLVTHALSGLLADDASVVTIGASAALRGRPFGVHYSASKAALVGFTRALAKELGGRGVRVNLVSPGVTGTEPDGTGGPPPEVARKLTAMTPLGRLCRPADVAGAVLYLAGDSAAYVTGAHLEVDGGI